MPKFIQISDIHYDRQFMAGGNRFCHGDSEVDKQLDESERYGRPGSECDSPIDLLYPTFKHLTTLLDIDFVLWTGDSTRHDRDGDLPRGEGDVDGAEAFVGGLMERAFGIGKVFPAVGNWDTYTPNVVTKKDLESLYHEWSPLWTRNQQELIKTTFLKGGYYAVPLESNITIISLNNIPWALEQGQKDCKKKNKQILWLQNTLETLHSTSSKAIIIGHIPPVNYLGDHLYSPGCFSLFTNLVGAFQDVILAQYYGHVNRDLTYFVTRNGEYDITPLNQHAIIDPNSARKDIVGLAFTGPSIVPYFYPGYRVGQLEFNDGWYLKSHTQYSARITNASEVIYNESCSTVNNLGLQRLTPGDFKSFLGNVQRELDVSGKSVLAGEYWDCSIVRFGSGQSAANTIFLNFLGIRIVILFVGAVAMSMGILALFKRKRRILI